MSSIIRKYLTSLVIVASIILGFLFPQVGVIWSASLILSLLLMFLMFFVTLSIDLREIVYVLKDYPIILVGLLTSFVLVPALALSTRPFFSAIVFAGVVLALCCPAAIVSSFWTKVFKGDIATALVMSIVTNLLSIVTIPATMLITVGRASNVDILGMMRNLAIIILIPLTVSYVLRRSIRTDWKKIDNVTSRVELGILVLIIWGSIAPGVGQVSSHIGEFALLNLFMLSILATAFTLTHFLSRKFGHKRAVAIEISTTVKNAALSLVIGKTAFGSTVFPVLLPPLIANLIAQNLLLIPAKALTEKVPSHAALAPVTDAQELGVRFIPQRSNCL